MSKTSEWGTAEEVERRRRINLAVWAFAYEVMDDPLVDDATFDRESQLVDLAQDTGDDELDLWFMENFDPSTGSWVQGHPNLEGLEKIYNKKRSRR